MLVRIRSGKGNVSGRDLPHVFSHFCTLGGASGCDAKVKLRLAQRCIRLRRKCVATSDLPKTCAIFQIRLFGKGSRFKRGIAFSRALPAGCLTSRIVSSGGIGRLLTGGCGRAVIVTRSSSRVLTCLGSRLSAGFHIVTIGGNCSTIGTIVSSRMSLVLDSILVPTLGKFRLYDGVGSGVTAYRVPVILLATLSSSGRQVCKVTRNTSRCVRGPFGVRCIHLGVVQVVRRHGHLTDAFTRGFNHLAERRTTGLPYISSIFQSGLFGLVRTRRDSDGFGVRLVDSVLKVSEVLLCQGVADVFKVSPSSLLHGCQLRGTIRLLASRQHGMDRITCVMKFSSPTCFTGYFGDMCGVAPARCVCQAQR